MDAMYEAMATSPYTTITSGISDSDTTIYVAELAGFPDAPNEAVLYDYSGNRETVRYSAKSAASGSGYLTISDREFDKSGSYGAKRAWVSGSRIARLFTAYDYNAFKSNLEACNTPKRTIFLSAGAGMPNETSGCEAWAQTELATNDIQIGYLEFKTAVDTKAQWIFVMPDNYDGSTITAKIYWTYSTGSGDVKFGIKGGSFADNDALDQALGTQVTVTDTGITANDLHVTAETSAITLANTPAGGDLIVIQLSRLGTDASDTHGGSALLLGVKLEYGTNAVSD